MQNWLDLIYYYSTTQEIAAACSALQISVYVLVVDSYADTSAGGKKTKKKLSKKQIPDQTSDPEDTVAPILPVVEV